MEQHEEIVLLKAEVARLLATVELLREEIERQQRRSAPWDFPGMTGAAPRGYYSTTGHGL